MLGKSLDVRLLGDPVLREKAAAIKLFDQELSKFVKRMQSTLLGGRVGVGLAAPQVGYALQVVVYDTKYVDGPGYLINPEIIERHGEDIEHEACLSFPGEYFAVKRCAELTVRTRTLDGGSITLQGDDLLARLVQHEVEHLNGVLIVDHLEASKRARAIEVYSRRLENLYGRDDVTSVSMSGVGELFRSGGYELRR